MSPSSSSATSMAARRSYAARLPVGTTRILGLGIVNASGGARHAWLCERLKHATPTRVAFLNAHCGNVSARDTAYRAALANADVLLPDGSGIAMALRLRGEQLIANLNGTDLTPALCVRLAASGHSVFLLGGRPRVAEAAAFALQKAAPGLVIAGTRHGFFSKDEEPSILHDINASGASVLLVALGVPRQDLWLAQMSSGLRPALTLGVGGLFDFLSGRIPRAPMLVRRIGLEWVWRLYQEPARMWRRYVIGNPEFMVRAVADALPSPVAMLTRVDSILKRTLDLVASALGFAITAPLMLVISALVRLETKGPAVLRQTRIGQEGRPFTVYKFRSMHQDAEARRAALLTENCHGEDGVTFKMKRDPRVTRVGRLLRKSSLDELPQLFNVFEGTMSLVGPRPPLPSEVKRYTAHQRLRLIAKPGITGLWQVSGRANLPFPRQVELDIEYLARRNVLLDLKILARTVPAVLFARGAY